MSLIRGQSCRGCAHSHAEGATRFCRAHPPSVHALAAMTPRGPQQVGTTSNFPAVIDDWWCGEWRPRIEMQQ
jgi:hypothetical protein